MKVAITGATGFLGRYVVDRLLENQHECKGWFRNPDRQFRTEDVEWLPGELGDAEACTRLVEGCDAVIHSGLHRTGTGFRGSEGDVADFVQRNIVGTIQLIEAARTAGIRRFIYISTCAVHEKILDDRPLDEAHPLWMTTHYGAHKAAVEQFVHSYGFGVGFPIVAVRPTGIYGLHHQATLSKWYPLIRSIVRGENVDCSKGGKEVHAGDVAKAVELLLHVEGDAGEAYSCYDRYVSELEVATIAREITGSQSEVAGKQTSPKHQIVSDKIKEKGMTFGGEERLRSTISEIVDAVQKEQS